MDEKLKVQAAKAMEFADSEEHNPSPTAVFEEMVQGGEADGTDPSSNSAFDSASSNILPLKKLMEVDGPSSHEVQNSMSEDETRAKSEDELRARPVPIRRADAAEAQLKARPSRPAVRRNYPHMNVFRPNLVLSSDKGSVRRKEKIRCTACMLSIWWPELQQISLLEVGGTDSLDIYWIVLHGCMSWQQRRAGNEQHSLLRYIHYCTRVASKP